MTEEERQKTDEKDAALEDGTTKSTASSTAQEEKPPMSAEPSLGKIFAMSMPEMPMLIFAFLLMTGAEAVNLIVPLILANAYDTLVDISIPDDERMDDINFYMSRALMVYAAGTVAGYLRASILGVIGERMVARLRYKLYEAILKQEIGFFDEHKVRMSLYV